jgi:outer membrane protein assembly factor BamD (BamD/ComL family)
LFLLGLAILIAGCAGLKQARELQEADDYLRSARTLLRHGDFEGALRENEKALALAQGLPPADEVVFNIGVIYTQSEYAGKDEQKAAGYFEQVIAQYPESRFANWAKVWLAMIREGEDGAVQQPEFELKRRKAR